MTLESKFLHAVKIGDIEQVRKRIKNKRLNRECADERGYQAIHLSIEKNHPAVLKLLLDANFNIEATVNGAEPDLHTPLMIAVIHNNITAAKMLIIAGASINAESIYKETALFLAAELNRHEMVKLLLNADADTEVSNIVSNTALLIASCEGASESVEALLKKGANVYARDRLGRSAFFVASHNYHNKVANQLARRAGSQNLDEDLAVMPLEEFTIIHPS